MTTTTTGDNNGDNGRRGGLEGEDEQRCSGCALSTRCERESARWCFFPFFFVSPQPGVSNVLLIIMIVLYIRLYRLLARPPGLFHQVVVAERDADHLFVEDCQRCPTFPAKRVMFPPKALIACVAICVAFARAFWREISKPFFADMASNRNSILTNLFC